MVLFIRSLSFDVFTPLSSEWKPFKKRASMLTNHFKSFKGLHSGEEQFRSTKSWFSFVLACTLDLGDGGRVFDVSPTTGPEAVLKVAKIMDDILTDSYNFNGDRITFDVMKERMESWAEGLSCTPIQQKMAIAWDKFPKGPWSIVKKHYEAMADLW